MKKAIDNIEPEIVVRELDINVNDSNRSESAMDININIEDIFKDFDETHDQNSENNLENKTKDLIEENLSWENGKNMFSCDKCDYKSQGKRSIKKHEKTTKEKKGGIITKESFIDISNLKFLNLSKKNDKTEVKK